MDPMNVVIRKILPTRDVQLSKLVEDYDVIIMKHCYPASDVLEDIGESDVSSPRQSLENYQAIYRQLRDKFDENPDTLFIIWTIPPRHRLFEPSEGNRNENATRATVFSNWLKGDFLKERRPHPNIFIWDFRGLIIDPQTNFLKYEFELHHTSSNSHPNVLANNVTGPKFAQFIVDSINNFTDSTSIQQQLRIVFLCHSTGKGVYEYSDLGVKDWFTRYNTSQGINYLIHKNWYPSGGNMPVHYYRSWLINSR